MRSMTGVQLANTFIKGQQSMIYKPGKMSYTRGTTGKWWQLRKNNICRNRLTVWLQKVTRQSGNRCVPHRLRPLQGVPSSRLGKTAPASSKTLNWINGQRKINSWSLIGKQNAYDNKTKTETSYSVQLTGIIVFTIYSLTDFVDYRN